MVQMSLELPSQRRNSLGHILTRGYVHGHVHQHRDHVHIHGHIHNHDHIEPDSPNQGPSLGISGDSGLEQNTLSELERKELDNSFDLCNDIFCDELDDCYYYDCIRPDPAAASGGVSRDDTGTFCGTAPCDDFDAETAAECCDNEDCLVKPSENICADAACIEADHHDNSLCNFQKPRLTIFENLIKNVHRNIEQYAAPAPPQTFPGSVNPVADSLLPGSAFAPLNEEQNVPLASHDQQQQFHIHFPHHCHQERQQPQQFLSKNNPVLLNVHTYNPKEHTMHQSCFHARISTSIHDSKLSFLGEHTAPETKEEPFSEQQPNQYQNDYDFFVQFNNFKQIFADPHFHQPHTFLCQWENCLELVDSGSLLTHLLDSHLSHDSQLQPGNNQQGPVKLECEWDNCGFVDEDLKLFLNHLSTHWTEISLANRDHSPLLAPSAMDAVCDLPYAGASAPTSAAASASFITKNIQPTNKPNPGEVGKSAKTAKSAKDSKMESFQNTHRYGLCILDIRISPKRPMVGDPLAPLHMCKWQIGTGDSTGEPVLCKRAHSSDGDLQDHLKTDHIGRGKLIYHCCWHGCERNEGKPFAQRQKLFRHIHIHTGHKPCVCDVCGALFAVPSMLKQHLRVHSGEKPYTCNLCGRGFSTSSLLAIHTRVHMDSRPLECSWPGCNKRFRESSNLAKHLSTHLTTYTCDKCKKEFDQRRGYSRHVKTFHAAKDAEMGTAANK